MPYCPNCGSEVEQLPPALAVAETVNADVEIARIQAERDIEVAKIGARQDKDWNETRVEVAAIESEAMVGAAEAEAEVIGEIIAAETGTEEEGDPPAVILTAEPEEDDGEDLAPPEAEHHDMTPKPKPAWSF
jgi:hypothetical protein